MIYNPGKGFRGRGAGSGSGSGSHTSVQRTPPPPLGGAEARRDQRKEAQGLGLDDRELTARYKAIAKEMYCERPRPRPRPRSARVGGVARWHKSRVPPSDERR